MGGGDEGRVEGETVREVMGTGEVAHDEFGKANGDVVW